MNNDFVMVKGCVIGAKKRILTLRKVDCFLKSNFTSYRKLVVADFTWSRQII